MPIDYEHLRLTTPDGYELGLFRSRPIRARCSESRPVLLLPGAGANRFAFGVIRSHSLPAALNAVGRDVWLLEFRGSRSSRRLPCGPPSVSLDGKLLVDLPAAIDEILERTGAQKLDLVGHSLGGLFAYLHCGGPQASRIGRAVTLSSPATFRAMLGKVTPLLRAPVGVLAPAAARLPGLGIDKLAKVRGPIPHLAAMRQHLRPRALDRHERRLYLDHAIEDMPGGDLAQMMGWISRGRLHGGDGRDYEWRIGACRTPIRLIASSKDKLIPVAAVREAYQRIGSEEKDLVLVGRKHGTSRDYAHADVLLSKSASEEVHPRVVEWLERESVARLDGRVGGGRLVPTAGGRVEAVVAPTKGYPR